MVLPACNLLFREALGQVEKVQCIKRPKLIKKVPVVFSEAEVEYLLTRLAR
jgi:hypothetical protein